MGVKVFYEKRKMLSMIKQLFAYCLNIWMSCNAFWYYLTCSCFQTGSGKTYTMGTAYTVGDNTNGIIPRVMDLIFKRVENSPEKVEYQVRVSFIEVKA